MSRWRPSRAGAAIVLFMAAALVSIYLPAVGRGFVKDDVVWVATSRIQEVGDVANLLAASTGFFRPVVSASFAWDYAWFAVNPRGYGLTNLALLFCCVVAIGLLLRQLGTHPVVAIGGAFVWAFNFHGINMAVLWLSGRTALWVTLWWTLAAWGFLRRARLWPVLAAALAMLSKEEAFLLPVMLGVWAWLEPPIPAGARVKHVVTRTWPFWLGAVVLLAVRGSSGAITPWTAPEYYTYDLSFSRLASNLVQYADRALTLPVLVLVTVWLALDRPAWRLVDASRGVRGLSWVVLAFVPTVALPTRSSLYVVLPSVGVVVTLASLVCPWMTAVRARALGRAAAVLVAAAVLLWPVYKARTVRYEGEARLSSAVLQHIVEIARERGRGLVIIRDRRDERPTAEQAFGTLANEAAMLVTDDRIQAWIDPPPRDLAAAGVAVPPDLPVVGEIRVRGGAAERIH